MTAAARSENPSCLVSVYRREAIVASGVRPCGEISFCSSAGCVISS